MFNRTRKITIVFTLFALISLIFPTGRVSASSTDGTIDPASKYAWSENIGWINFGTAEGGVHVLDSALTGYAWSENAGWISLNCSNNNSCGTTDYKVANNGEGVLSGSAWSENTGWINFSPTNGGVVIDSSGVFSGSAWGENIGWVIFNCSTTNSCGTSDYKVSTDWRPQSARVVPGDDNPPPGGGGLPPEAYKPPIPPAGGFKILINQGAVTTSDRKVTLTFTVGPDVQRMAVSNTADFTGVGQETFASPKIWDLCGNSADCSAGKKTVYVKFYTSWGQPSAVVSDFINHNASEKNHPDTPPGDPTNPQPLPTSFISNTLVLDYGAIYLIMGQGKLGFVNMKVFKGLGYSLKNVVKGDTSAYPQTGVLSSASQAHPDGSWIISGKVVFYVHQDGYIPVPSWAVFLSNGGDVNYIVKANKADIKDKRPVLPPMTANDDRVKR